MSYSLKVGGSDTFLAGANSVTRRLYLTGKEFLHRRHARIYKQERFIVVGDEGKAAESEVSLALKEGEKALSQIVK
jgi:hypothetical protein